MKKYLLLFLQIFLFGVFANAQSIVFNGGTLTIQANGQIAADGNLLMEGTGTLQNDGTMIAKGNIVNNFANSGASLGNWTLNGTSNQDISGTSNLVVNNLTIDNSTGVTINKIVKVNGALTFTNGIIAAASATNPLILGAAATIPTSPNNSKHVNGYVVKEGITAFTFPTGNGTNYQPVGVSAIASNTNGISAKYNVGSPGGTNGALDSFNAGENWDLAPFNSGSASAKVTIFWDGINDTSPIQIADRKVGHLVGGAMLNHGGTTSGDVNVGSVVSTDVINSWSPFVLGFKAAVALPITMLSFEAQKIGAINKLKWETSSEINASHFEIERSNSINSFEKIGTIAANNLKNEISKYYFDDKNPINGQNYYRLKMVDFNSKFEYSKIIQLNNTENMGIVGYFYPNPTHQTQSNVDIMAKETGTWTIQQYDLSGRLINTEVRNLEKGMNKITVDKTVQGESIFKFESKDAAVVRKLIKN